MQEKICKYCKKIFIAESKQQIKCNECYFLIYKERTHKKWKSEDLTKAKKRNIIGI